MAKRLSIRYDQRGNRRYRKSGVTITEHKAADGTLSYGAHVRLKNFKAIWKSHPTEALCIAWAKGLTNELRGKKEQAQSGNILPESTSVTVAALIKSYLGDPVEIPKLRPQYVKALTRSLEWWSANYGTLRVMEFGRLQVREARNRLLAGIVRGKKRSPATVRNRMMALRSAWAWGQTAGLVAENNVWPKGLMPSSAPERKRYLSDAELASVLTWAKEHSSVLHAAIVLAVATGVRAGELLRLTWADIDFDRQCITVLITKTGQPKSVHLPPSAIAALKTLKAAPVVSMTNVFLAEDMDANGKPRPLTYDQLDGLWRELRTAVGLKDCRWHDLRHCCASYLAQAGASLQEIGAVLGHRSYQSTQRYSHLIAGAPVTGHDALDRKLQKNLK